MTVAELTLEVLAEKLLTQSDSKKLVEWAVSALQLGCESENLIILAGLDMRPLRNGKNISGNQFKTPVLLLIDPKVN